MLDTIQSIDGAEHLLKVPMQSPISAEGDRGLHVVTHLSGGRSMSPCSHLSQGRAIKVPMQSPISGEGDQGPHAVTHLRGLLSSLYSPPCVVSCPTYRPLFPFSLEPYVNEKVHPMGPSSGVCGIARSARPLNVVFINLADSKSTQTT